MDLASDDTCKVLFIILGDTMGYAGVYFFFLIHTELFMDTVS